MSIFKFLTKRSTLICLAILVAAAFLVPVDVLAQTGEVNPETARNFTQGGTGPFELFLMRAARMFSYTRNALFFIAAFAFIGYAWSAIQEGKINWKELLYLIVALVLLGVAGFIVTFIADPQRQAATQSHFPGLNDTNTWGN
ncbi:MAG: hypothetical protein LBO78_03615 [Rickettsiales bacterium]|nr:hypothetical protein [Rickettsiales bacterium]